MEKVPGRWKLTEAAQGVECTFGYRFKENKANGIQNPIKIFQDLKDPLGGKGIPIPKKFLQSQVFIHFPK